MGGEDGLELLGRIDITLKFLRQFGNKGDYVGVECKTVGAGSLFKQLSLCHPRVQRFINGHYATDHAWGFMLGYVLALSADAIVQAVDNRLQSNYGAAAALDAAPVHIDAIAIHEGEMQRQDGSSILRDIIVDMAPAAPASG